MFPIPFNIPFRKKDGSLSTLGDELNNGGGGGSSYTLPTASADVKGGVKIGSGLTMDGETLNNSNPTPYSLPTASDEVKGGVKIGNGLSIDENGVLSASGGSGGSTIKSLEIDIGVGIGVVESNKFISFQVSASALNGKSVIGVSGVSGSSNCQVLGIAHVASEYWSVLGYNNTTSQQKFSKVIVYYID